MKKVKIVLCLVFALGIFTASNLYAQSLGVSTDINIQTTPNFPEPYEEVVVKLDAYAINTTGATITWYLDNVEVPNSRNTREITYTAGSIGDSVEIGVTITAPNKPTLAATHTVTPSRVDIIIESDSLVPLHYKGRALPSSGSTLRAIALPVVSQSLGDLSYTWSIDNQVLSGGSLIGKNVIEFEIPKKPELFLTLDVADEKGMTITRKTILVEVFNPELYFYEDNPLRGLSRQAITGNHLLVGEEITVRAEPYYMSSNIFETNPHIEWQINGREVENPSENTQNLTLRAGEGSGSFRVGFHIRNLQNLLQGVKDDFTISF